MGCGFESHRAYVGHAFLYTACPYAVRPVRRCPRRQPARRPRRDRRPRHARPSAGSRPGRRRRRDPRLRQRRRRGQPQRRPDGGAAGRAAGARPGRHRQPALRQQPPGGDGRLAPGRDRRRAGRARRRRRVDDAGTVGAAQAGASLPRRQRDAGVDHPRLAPGQPSGCPRSGRSRWASATSSWPTRSASAASVRTRSRCTSHQRAAQAWADGFYDDLVAAGRRARPATSASAPMPT